MAGSAATALILAAAPEAMLPVRVWTGIAVAAAGIAKILFVVFLVLFLVSLIAHTTRRV